MNKWDFFLREVLPDHLVREADEAGDFVARQCLVFMHLAAMHGAHSWPGNFGQELQINVTVRF